MLGRVQASLVGWGGWDGSVAEGLQLKLSERKKKRLEAGMIKLLTGNG